MRTHKFAEIFPLMNDKESTALKQDIQEKGLQEEIVTFEEKILDGRNRYNACQELNLTPKFRQYKGNDALGYVTSTNLKRRQLTDSQKAVVGTKYKKHYIGPAAERQKASRFGGEGTSSLTEEEIGRAIDKAGKAVGVSGKYIYIWQNKLLQKNQKLKN